MTKQGIQDDLKKAMMAKDEATVSTLRMLLSAIQVSERTGELHAATQEELMTVTAREAKRRKEAIEEYTKALRNDLAQKEQKELSILETYLPQSLNTEELTTIIKEAITAIGATTAQDFGRVMKEVTSKTRGRADGKIVSDTVKALLG